MLPITPSHPTTEHQIHINRQNIYRILYLFDRTDYSYTIVSSNLYEK